MGKRRWCVGLALLMAAMSAAPAEAEAETAAVVMNEDERIEQVYLNLPEVYVYGEGFSPEEVEAGEGYLSQDKLELIDARPFSETGEGICDVRHLRFDPQLLFPFDQGRDTGAAGWSGREGSPGPVYLRQ